MAKKLSTKKKKFTWPSGLHTVPPHSSAGSEGRKDSFIQWSVLCAVQGAETSNPLGFQLLLLDLVWSLWEQIHEDKDLWEVIHGITRDKLEIGKGCRNEWVSLWATGIQSCRELFEKLQNTPLSFPLSDREAQGIYTLTPSLIS